MAWIVAEALLWYLAEVKFAFERVLSRRFFLVVLSVAALAPSRAQAFEHRHAVGVGYHSGHVFSETAGGFHFRSFPVSYVARLGGDWAALVRVSALFPLRARQEDLTFSPRSEYERTQQWDALCGATFRFTQIAGFDVDAGLGAHFHYARFQSTTYVEWSTAALGLGLGAGVRRAILPEVWGRPEVGLLGDLSYDFIDLSRGGDMAGGVQGQLLVSLGGVWGAP